MTNWNPSEAEKLAETFGIVLGAAACNDDISDERIASASEKMRGVLSAAANDAADARAACDRFSAAVVSGRAAAQAGRINRGSATSALSELEELIEGTMPT